MSLYTLEMAAAVRNMPPPVPFTLDIVENEEFITLLVYENEVKRYPAVDQQRITRFLNDVGKILLTFDTPARVRIKGVPGEPGRI